MLFSQTTLPVSLLLSHSPVFSQSPTATGGRNCASEPKPDHTSFREFAFAVFRTNERSCSSLGLWFHRIEEAGYRGWSSLSHHQRKAAALVPASAVADRGSADLSRLGTAHAHDTLVDSRLNAVVLLNVQLGQSVVLVGAGIAQVTLGRGIDDVPVFRTITTPIDSRNEIANSKSTQKSVQRPRTKARARNNSRRAAPDDEPLDGLVLGDELGGGGAAAATALKVSFRTSDFHAEKGAEARSYRTRLTCPRPFLFLPWFLRLTVMVCGE